MALTQTLQNAAPPRSHHPSPNIALGLGEFKRITRIMYEDAGIAMSEEKINLVHARLQKRLRALSLKSFKSYCQLVESKEGIAERKIMLNALTTNLTRFYREPHHFKHLIEVTLPPLMQAAKNGKRVRIWSAGCSTGEEAYSIACIIHSLYPDVARYDVKILASDIDSNVIRVGHAGVYSKSSVENLPVKIRERYFQQIENDRNSFQVADCLKSLISFRHLNLNHETWPMKGTFDIIFCRNTVIYFDEATQAQVWTKFKDKLVPKGHLYIGHSERLSGPDADAFSKAGNTIYQLKG